MLYYYGGRHIIQYCLNWHETSLLTRTQKSFNNNRIFSDVCNKERRAKFYETQRRFLNMLTMLNRKQALILKLVLESSSDDTNFIVVCSSSVFENCIT
jgi:hypothetical protein